MVDCKYLPDTSAMLVYQDEHGNQCSSFVKIVRPNNHTGTLWYVVIGNQEIFSMNHLVIPIEKAKIDIEEGKGLALVREDQLAPVGTRTFRIVQ
jgi:formate/nitrite transporter FocA (FNT family)